MPVVTIARQYGAGGESVGQMLSRKLKIDLLDPHLIAEVAKRLELPHEAVAAEDERPGTFLGRLLHALGSASTEPSIPPEVAGWTPPYADPAFDPRRAVLEITQQVIKEAAREGNVVIVGRGGAYILSEMKGALHVYLRAAVPARTKTIMERFKLSEEEARRKIKQTDENRTAYIRQVYGHDWNNPSHYDIVLDTGRLGYDATVDAIVAALPGRSR